MEADEQVSTPLHVHYICKSHVGKVSKSIVDTGTSTTRTGYARDDTPRTVFPITYGYTPYPVRDSATSTESCKLRLYVGDNVSEWRPGMQRIGS